jgi:hypothetical protein
MRSETKRLVAMLTDASATSGGFYRSEWRRIEHNHRRDRAEGSPPLDSLAWEAPTPVVKPALECRKEAKLRGYEGEACPECANFTLVRNGTCLKCDTCGGTTGCS